MNKFLLIILLLNSSCSTLKSSRFWGRVGGTVLLGSLGYAIGKESSPNKESEKVNSYIGITLGAGVGAFAGDALAKYFYKEDPLNFEDKEIIIDKKVIAPQELINNSELSLNDLGIFTEKSIYKVYKTPVTSKIPKSLKKKINSQIVLKYKLKPRKIKLKDGRVIHFLGGEALEHRYIEN